MDVSMIAAVILSQEDINLKDRMTTQKLSKKRHEFFTINHVIVLATEKMKTSTMYHSLVFSKIF